MGTWGAGGFCHGDIDPPDLVALWIHRPIDEINVLDRMFWCHLACLNASLHPRHIVQNWTFEADDLEQDIKDSLDPS